MLLNLLKRSSSLTPSSKTTYDFFLGEVLSLYDFFSGVMLSLYDFFSGAELSLHL